jgi:hypothetical protein
MKPAPWKLILITPIFILLSHYPAVLLHEFSHSFMAWALGFKTNPFALNYGGTGFWNLLLLINVDHNVNNKMIYALGHPGLVALIASAGPCMNILLFVVSFCLLQTQKIKQRAYWFYFLLFFNLMNLGNIYDYVPIRTFAINGNMVDVVDIEQGMHWSPWWIYLIVGYLLSFLVWQFFTRTLPAAYLHVKIQSTAGRAALMITCVCIFFGYFALPGFFNHGPVSAFLSATSWMAIPGIIVALWPTRNWVKLRFEELG